MAKTLSPFGLRLVEASICEEPKDDKDNSRSYNNSDVLHWSKDVCWGFTV